MRAGDPAKFRVLNAENRYKDLVRVVTEYLAACEANPDAEIMVNRWPQNKNS